MMPNQTGLRPHNNLEGNEMSCEELFITFLVLFFFFGLGAAIVESLPRRKKPMATRNKK